jgi:starch-binding outer membrane protein, SusD/RagB family
MKKIIYSLIIIWGFAVSCQEEILDKQPLDIISDVVVWNDESLMDDYLTGIYTDTWIFAKDANDRYQANQWTQPLIMDIIADEAAEGTGWGQMVTGGRKFGDLRINGGIFEWYEPAYDLIRRLNIFIQRAPDAPVTEEYKKSRLAETRFLRAYNYFAMVIRYGGVPLITEAQDIDAPEDELYLARDSEKAIYDFVISECDAIFNDLPSVRTSDYGRPTKWAAAALKCRAALYAGSIAQFGTQQLNGLLGFPSSDAQGYYQKSYDAAKTIINDGPHSLYNKYPDDKVKNFQQLFLEDGNPEVIFCRMFNDMDGSREGGNGWALNFFQAPLPNAWGGGNLNRPYLEMVDEFETIDGTPGEPAPLDRDAIQQGLWSSQELFGNKEPRFHATIYYQDMPWKGDKITWYRGLIKPNGELLETGFYEGTKWHGNQNFNGTQSGTGFGVLKYLTEDIDIRGQRALTPTDWKLFRYGEVLLNLAEAAFELGKTGEALEAINQVRDRAGVAALTDIDRDKIRHERKIELAFENHRYWDLRRWRTAVTKLSRDFTGLGFKLDYETGKYKVSLIEKFDGVTRSPKFYEYNYYLPITLDRTGKNPNLVENPGYE